MRKIFIISMLFTYNVFAINLGSIATASNNGVYYKMGKDISSILSPYKIQLKPVSTDGSFENISILDGHDVKHKNTYFAIVQKDAISYYNYTQRTSSGKNMYNKIPAVLSLGTEQIHIFTSKNNNFNFENRKTYKVYCGQSEGGSCISAEYIEKAYNFKFIYVNTKKETVEQKLQNGMLDLYISVISAPAKKYENMKNLKLVSLPTNLIMDTMYTHKNVNTSIYDWVDESIDMYSVPRVLITSLTDKQYDVVIDSIVKIILKNRNKLKIQYPDVWGNINYEYVSYKNFSKVSKEIINKTF